jgi:antitoxin HicB
MGTEFRYPVELIQDGDQVIARVIDVPAAITFGSDVEHALHEAEDALVVALSGYLDRREAIPLPSKATRGQPCVLLHPLTAAKATLHNAMLAAGETNVSLAQKLGLTEAVVRRLLDLDHRSHIGQVEQALELLGFRLVVSVARVA